MYEYGYMYIYHISLLRTHNALTFHEYGYMLLDYYGVALRERERERERNFRNYHSFIRTDAEGIY